MEIYAPEKLPSEAYARAEQHLPWFVVGKVKNADVRPFWINQTDRFWFKYDLPEGGYEFRVTDAKSGDTHPAFDHATLAGVLSERTNNPVQANSLPIEYFEFSEDEASIECKIGGERISFDLSNNTCTPQPELSYASGELISPDGQWVAFARDNNLYVRSVNTGKETPLTSDGESFYAYAGGSDASAASISDRAAEGTTPTKALWSPDSKRLLTHRLDERDIQDMYRLQSVRPDGVKRPKLHTRRIAMPGDPSLPEVEMMVFDVETGVRTTIDYRRFQVFIRTPVEIQTAWWNETGDKVYLIDKERGERCIHLLEADPQTGKVRNLISESCETGIETNLLGWNPANIRIFEETNEFIWFSERDGWAHLYLYDLSTGECKSQITSGEFVVRDILIADPVSRELVIIAGGHEAGRDPYYQHVYSGTLDGGELALLTPEDAEHVLLIPTAPFQTFLADVPGDPLPLSLSPSSDYFVDNYSRADCAPKSVLRRSIDGSVVTTLKESDVSDLEAEGWVWPEPFKTLARDGKSEVWGLIHRPTSFDPNKKYPVIDHIYAGPQAIRTNKTSFTSEAGGMSGYLGPQAMADLGFIVITADGLGMPLRSREFSSFSYNNLQDASIPDHVAAIKQLAERHQEFDLDRVGIWGHSGGGFSSVRAMLTEPEFFKVCVSSAGNHDQRGYLASWGERYMGLPQENDYEPQCNANLAANLQGKLMLAWADMDDNVSPSMSIQLIDELIKANKDFDLFVMPNGDHRFLGHIYFIRRVWDFFVKNLLDAEPPEGYQLFDWQQVSSGS